MECTQRLECTQDFNAESFPQRSSPEQIGFLGICGQTYPVNLGPNKIGRDPQTCHIVLDMKSLSRQHAVINVLNKREYMLMDLGSVNKTKLGIKTLQAYLPYPLKNGDTVQFGDVFGIFRLCDDETELPMTQQFDIPDTPVLRPAAGSGARTLVPESPDVSDKDDSFVASSQQSKKPQFKTPKTHFIKPLGKTILRPCIGGNKIDNIYWNSSQKSPQLRLDESGDSLNDSSSSANTFTTVVNKSNRSSDIHEMDTQVPPGHNDSTDSIYTANTQLPTQNNSPSIHNLATQLPVENLPSVQKVEQNEMQFELSMSSRDNSIHNAETQAFPNNDVNEAETQAFCGKNENPVHEMNTQFVLNTSVHNENTQVVKNPIHNAQTQLIAEDIEDEEIPLTGDNTKTTEPVALHEKTSESDEDILEVFDDIEETEFTPKKLAPLHEDMRIETEIESPKTPCKSSVSPNHKCKETPSNSKINVAKNESDDDIIYFEEIDGHGIESFESQPLILPESSPNKSSDKENHEPLSLSRQENSQSPIIGVKRSKMRLDSDSSTDCEDIAILPTQNIVEKKADDDDIDCEDSNVKEVKKRDSMEVAFDELAEMTQMLEEDIPKNSPILQKLNLKKGGNKKTVDVEFNEIATQLLEENLPKTSPSKSIAIKSPKEAEVSFEEMATQILEEDDLPKDTLREEEVDFEDMPTQIINEDDLNDSVKKPKSEMNKSNDVVFEEMATQIIDEDVQQSEPVFSEEIVSPFKIPFISPIKVKRKDLAKLATARNIPKPPATSEQNDEKYYAATQEIFDDLCTQQEPDKTEKEQSKVPSKVDDEIVLCSDEEYEIQDRFRHIEQMSPKEALVADTSLSDDEKKVNEYVSSLSAKQIKDVVGLNESVVILSKKSSSDLSDIEVTPKKVHPLKFMNALLPDSQEIKVSITTDTRLDKTESSSESEADSNSQDNTPILFKKKVRTKKEAKIDLTKKFDVDALPTRFIARVRKAPAKLLQDVKTEHLHTTMLKPRFLTEQEDNIDTEIIIENITRLKNNNVQKKDESDVVEKKGTYKLTASKNNVKKHSNKTKQKVSNIKEAKKPTKDSPNKDRRTDKLDIIKDNENSKFNTKDAKNQSVVNSKVAELTSNNKSAEKVREEPQRRSNRKSDENETKESADKSKDNITSDGNIEISTGRTRSKNTSDKPKTKDTKEKPKSKERESNEKTSEKSTNTKPPSVTKGILKNNTIEEIVNLESDQEDPKTTIARAPKSTRGRKKVEKECPTPEPRSKSPDMRARPPSRRGKKSHSPPAETEPEPPIRRSKRQKASDSQSDSQTTKTTKTKTSKRTDSQTDSQTKMTSFVTTSKNADSQNESKPSKETRKRKLTDPKQDQSTVYNISAQSNPDSPAGIQRAASEVKGPSPKRTRSANAHTSANMSLRSTTSAIPNTVQKVLFTAFPNDEVKIKLEKLGATIVSDVMACDVLVTLQIKRTFKLLCVVGLGKPIVGPSWVQACVDNSRIVDPWQYLMRDEAAEKRFKFDLQRTLAGRRQFLAGHRVSSTPSVMPSTPEMKLIVQSSGGVWKEGGPNWICVSTDRDKALWPALKKKGAAVVSTELILAGVLRQELDIQSNKLC